LLAGLLDLSQFWFFHPQMGAFSTDGLAKFAICVFRFGFGFGFGFEI